MPSPAPAGQVMPCQLVSSAAQVRHAREQARKALFDWGLGDHAWLAELIVSELLANAIRHGRGQPGSACRMPPATFGWRSTTTARDDRSGGSPMPMTKQAGAWP